MNPFGLAVTAFAAFALVAPYPTADLSDELEASTKAEFSGRRLVVTWADDGPEAGLYPVGQSGGMSFVEVEGREIMVGDGEVVDRSGSIYSYVAVDKATPTELSGRYEVDGPHPTELMGRAAREVDVREAGRLRARFVFDEATAAVLLQETYDGHEELYRVATLLELDPGAEPSMSGEEMPAPAMMTSTEPEFLPATAGGYQRMDAYAAPAEGVQVFYSDGLFTFSVFELDRRVDAGALEEAPSRAIGAENGYRFATQPTGVWVFWRTADHAFLLVGDLPPDHLESVVAELPPPGRANPAKRFWRFLFG